MTSAGLAPADWNGKRSTGFSPANKADLGVMDETNLSTAQPSELPPGSEDRAAQSPDASLAEAAGTQEGAQTPPRDVAPGSNEMPETEAALSSQPEGDSPASGARETPSGEAAALPPDAEPAEVASGAGESPAAEPSGTPPKKESEPVATAVEPSPEELPKSDKMDWYILKVQSNREESIRDGLRKKIKIAGLERYFGDIIIPTEKVTEFKGGKRKVLKRKLYPGYLVVQMEINEDTWFLVRETTGIGDFTGAGGHPTPMQPREVAAILAKQEEKADEAPKLKIAFRVGDHVKIKEGTFENFEGEVANIDETNGRVTVLINIFGRSTPVDIEYWQIEKV